MAESTFAHSVTRSINQIKQDIETRKNIQSSAALSNIVLSPMAAEKAFQLFTNSKNNIVSVQRLITYAGYDITSAKVLKDHSSLTTLLVYQKNLNEKHNTLQSELYTELHAMGLTNVENLK